MKISLWQNSHHWLHLKSPFSGAVSEENFVKMTTLTHWGRVTHICVGKSTIIGSDNGLSPGRCQAIIWINDGILLIWPLGTNFSEIFSKIHTFSFKKMHLKTLSAEWRPFCLGLNVLKFQCVLISCCSCHNLFSIIYFSLVVNHPQGMHINNSSICIKLTAKQLFCRSHFCEESIVIIRM